MQELEEAVLVGLDILELEQLPSSSNLLLACKRHTGSIPTPSRQGERQGNLGRTDTPLLEMQVHLVEELMKHDTGEALHWNNIFQLNLFPHNAASTTAPHLLNPWIPVLENNFTGAEEYYQLHFSDDQVIFVDNSEKFDMFLGDVGSQRQVGVDAEFMNSSSEQKISLLQVTQLCFSFSTLFLSSIRLLPKVVPICLTLRVFPLH